MEDVFEGSGIDTVTEEVEDVLECFRVDVEVENVVVPTLGNKIFEDGRAI